jgi:hypothetical protein
LLPKPSSVVSTYFTEGAQVATDWQTGWVFAHPYGNGIWRSKDTCKSWQRIDDGKIGCGMSGGVYLSSLYTTQEGYIGFFGILFPHAISGTSCGYSLDRGETWGSFTNILRNWNHGTIDFVNGAKCALGQVHEESGGFYKTTDGGANWRQLQSNDGNPGTTSLGIFSPAIFIASNSSRQLVRSQDSGKTWTPLASGPAGPAYGPLQFFNRKPYWLAAMGVYTSPDSGRQWNRVGSQFPEACWAGPFFGNDEGRMVCVTTTKFIESIDSGKTWYVLAPLPAGFAAEFKHYSFAYDHRYDVLYANCYIGSTTGFFKLPLCRWPFQQTTAVRVRESEPTTNSPANDRASAFRFAGAANEGNASVYDIRGRALKVMRLPKGSRVLPGKDYRSSVYVNSAHVRQVSAVGCSQRVLVLVFR